MLNFPVIPTATGWYWVHYRQPEDHVHAKRCGGWVCAWLDPELPIEICPEYGPRQVLSGREWLLLTYDQIGPRLDPPVGDPL